jgi:hypothetical protein
LRVSEQSDDWFELFHDPLTNDAQILNKLCFNLIREWLDGRVLQREMGSQFWLEGGKNTRLRFHALHIDSLQERRNTTWSRNSERNFQLG